MFKKIILKVCIIDNLVYMVWGMIYLQAKLYLLKRMYKIFAV